MSQIYHIELKSSVSETFTMSDQVTHTLNLTPIIELEEMLNLLEDLLIAEGYQKDSAAKRSLSRKNERGEHVVFDLDLQEVVISLTERQELSAQVSVKGSFDQDFVSRDEGKNQVQKDLEIKEETARQGLNDVAKDKQRLLTQRLSNHIDDQRCELNTLLQQVYAESIKRKARQLGDVMEINESIVDGQYELVIKIEA